ncbi:hypothetical protein [Nostoc sphaeroides]|uniref:Uncharacterized protein n=1 Tax=Nostoc sphaeroides CCNUC1 TaxID=2653204 RepID=A0A5P8W954_9NOSO|nr:hypothetical protein [Nostoc sphaeroides]QFS48726.1 hypothetical protein GXM_06220 [Nostoc sphaeroides CCNUC1]
MHPDQWCEIIAFGTMSDFNRDFASWGLDAAIASSTGDAFWWRSAAIAVY